MNTNTCDLFRNKAIKNRMKLFNHNVIDSNNKSGQTNLRWSISDALNDYICNTPETDADIGQIIRAIDKIDNALYTINKAERLKSIQE